MISIGDRVYILSMKGFFAIGNFKQTGIIIDKMVNPRFPNSEDMAKFRIRLDRRILWIFPAYEWVTGDEIYG